MTNWQPRRTREQREAATRNMLIAAAVLIVTVLLYSIAFKPLPDGHERVATSPEMQDFLRRTNR